MKILADESVESEIVAALAALGHEISDVKQISPGINDEQVLELARTTGAILLTNDKDFGDLIYRDRRFSEGVVLLRFGKLEMRTRIELVSSLLQAHQARLRGNFAVVTAFAVRIRG